MSKRSVILILIVIIVIIIVIPRGNGLPIPLVENSEKNKASFYVHTKFNHRLITDVNTGTQKLVALTFDDGPDPKFTPQVLDILKANHVPATFFVIGKKAVKYPALIKREVREGHEVENHTYTHPEMDKRGKLAAKKEIIETEKVIKQLTKRQPHYFRPPKKLFTNETVDIAEQHGYKVVLWRVCIENQNANTVNKMANRVIKRAKPGIIILGHDGRLDRSATVKTLPLIIKEYRRKGYTFVTLTELLKYQKR